MKKMSTLTSEPITLADTALERHQQIIKRQVDNVVTKISWEEREESRNQMEQMDGLKKEEHSPLISAMPYLACKKAPSKPDEQLIHKNTEMNNRE